MVDFIPHRLVAKSVRGVGVLRWTHLVVLHKSVFLRRMVGLLAVADRGRVSWTTVAFVWVDVWSGFWVFLSRIGIVISWGFSFLSAKDPHQTSILFLKSPDLFHHTLVLMGYLRGLLMVLVSRVENWKGIRAGWAVWVMVFSLWRGLVSIEA
jgi:hypothetical protein